MTKKTEVLRLTKKESELVTAVRELGEGTVFETLNNLMNSEENRGNKVLKQLHHILNPNKQTTLKELVDSGFITKEDADTLIESVLNNKYVAIAGCHGTGKTTLLKAVLEEIKDTRSISTLCGNDKSDLGYFTSFGTITGRYSSSSITGAQGTGVTPLVPLLLQSVETLVLPDIRFKEDTLALLVSLIFGKPSIFTTSLEGNIAELLKTVDIDTGYVSEELLEGVELVKVVCTRDNEGKYKASITND